jgi:hypothetical protein
MSFSFFKPSGVISNTQENTRNSGKPIASTVTTMRAGASPNPYRGKMVSAASMSSHDAAR